MWGAGQMMFNKILVLSDGQAASGIPIDDYKNLARYVLNNLNPVTDVYFSQGPMDVLDHSCSKLGFGGKMCIDGTKKTDEEITTPLLPFKADTGFSKSAMMLLLPEITGINDRLAIDWGIPVLFVAVKKDRSNHVMDVHNTICKDPTLNNIKIICYVEHTVSTDDIADVLWRFCNNLDPKRDHFYAGSKQHILGLDGTRKTKKLDGFERPWPNILASDDDTIAAVDKKWADLGLGPIINSPSLRYKTQLYGGAASVYDND
jgi:4-hydroxy-3-polyprenylbenzoate decarboxylase